jgi:hypothetical protein
MKSSSGAMPVFIIPSDLKESSSSEITFDNPSTMKTQKIGELRVIMIMFEEEFEFYYHSERSLLY